MRKLNKFNNKWKGALRVPNRGKGGLMNFRMLFTGRGRRNYWTIECTYCEKFWKLHLKYLWQCLWKRYGHATLPKPHSITDIFREFPHIFRTPLSKWLKKINGKKNYQVLRNKIFWLREWWCIHFIINTNILNTRNKIVVLIYFYKIVFNWFTKFNKKGKCISQVR